MLPPRLMALPTAGLHALTTCAYGERGLPFPQISNKILRLGLTSSGSFECTFLNQRLWAEGPNSLIDETCVMCSLLVLEQDHPYPPHTHRLKLGEGSF